MRKLLFFLVFISPPFGKKWLLKWFYGAQIGRRVRIGWFSSIMGRRIAIGEYAEIGAFTLIWADQEVVIGRYTVISHFAMVYGSAAFRVGDHCYIGPQSFVNVTENVEVGQCSAIGPRSMIFTHGSFLPLIDGYWVKFAPVRIGNYTWIAAGVFIHPGVTVGNNVFVNSRSVLTRDVADGDVMEGFPAKTVASMDRLKREITPQRMDAITRQILRYFEEMHLKRELNIEIGDHPENYLSFRYRGRNYLVLCIDSSGKVPPFKLARPPDRILCLVNASSWIPPSHLAPVMVFDMTTRMTSSTRDPIHRELYAFMRKYVGTQFEYKTA